MMRAASTASSQMLMNNTKTVADALFQDQDFLKKQKLKQQQKDEEFSQKQRKFKDKLIVTKEFMLKELDLNNSKYQQQSVYVCYIELFEKRNEMSRTNTNFKGVDSLIEGTRILIDDQFNELLGFEF